MNDQKTLLYAALRDDLRWFIQKVFGTVSPGDAYRHNWHIDAIAYALTRVMTGEVKRLVITMPPRFLKSISASVAFVAWVLGRDPTARIICASYGTELTTKHSLDTRLVMESDWYRECFPGTALSDDHNKQTHFSTTQQGFRFATSVGGPLTGLGSDYLIIDDANKGEDASSEAKLKQVLDWFSGTASTRLNQPDEGRIIVVQQRMHENDLPGFLLEIGGWTHLNLPAIAELSEQIPVGPGRFHKRMPGDLLHPERVSQKWLDDQRVLMGSGGFNAQFQQRPGPAGDQIVKWNWFKTYALRDGGPLIRFEKEPGDVIVQSWDQAYTKTSTSSFSVCTTWLYRDERFYLLHVLRKKFEYPELLRKTQSFAADWDADHVIVEATGAGQLLAQQLRRIDPWKFMWSAPSDDKVTRLTKVSPLIEQGLVYVPDDAPWLPTFKQELEYFPNGKFDDQVDSLSQALRWLHREVNMPRTRITMIPK